MSQASVELVERAIEVVQREGPRALFAQGLAAPDAEWHAAPELPGAARYVGADGFAEFLRIWTEDLDDWSLKLERVRSEGNCVLAIPKTEQSARGVEFRLRCPW